MSLLSPSIVTILKWLLIVAMLMGSIGAFVYGGYQWASAKDAVTIKNAVIAQQKADLKAREELQAQVDEKQKKIDDLSNQLSVAQTQVKTVTKTIIQTVHSQLAGQTSVLQCQLPPAVTSEINQNANSLNQLFGDSSK